MILDPIYQLFDSIINDKKDKWEKMLVSLGLVLKTDERELTGKALLKKVMQKWLPAGDAVLEMIVLHLPSPREAQRYRTDMLYEGPLDGESVGSWDGTVRAMHSAHVLLSLFIRCSQTLSRFPCATATRTAHS